MKKNVTFFIPSFNGGGAEKTTIFLSNAFADKSYEVTLITLNSNGVYKSYIQDNVNIIDLKKSRVLKSIPFLIRYFKEKQPDTFISAMTHVNIVSIIAKLLSGVETRLIISMRSVTSKTFSSKFKKFRLKLLINNLYSYAHRVVCISNAVANDLIDNYDVDKDKILVINNPIIYPEIYTKSNEKINVEKNEDEKLVLGVGRLENVKNFSVLIKAINILKNSGYSIKLLILGEGSQRGNLETLIDELSLGSIVSMPGFKANIYPYYREADIFVLPSKNEGLGNVIVEAMAFGLPVIAAKNSGGPEEILEHGKLGALFVNDSPEDLALKLEQVMINNKEKKVYGDVKKYQINEIANQYEKLIKKV